MKQFCWRSAVDPCCRGAATQRCAHNTPHASAFRPPTTMGGGNGICDSRRYSTFPRVVTMSGARAAVLAVFLAGACRDATTPLQPRLPVHPSGAIAGQYIVVFRDEVANPVGLARSLVDAEGGALF